MFVASRGAIASVGSASSVVVTIPRILDAAINDTSRAHPVFPFMRVIATVTDNGFVNVTFPGGVSIPCPSVYGAFTHDIAVPGGASSCTVEFSAAGSAFIQFGEMVD